MLYSLALIPLLQAALGDGAVTIPPLRGAGTDPLTVNVRPISIPTVRVLLEELALKEQALLYSGYDFSRTIRRATDSIAAELELISVGSWMLGEFGPSAVLFESSPHRANLTATETVSTEHGVLTTSTRVEERTLTELQQSDPYVLKSLLQTNEGIMNRAGPSGALGLTDAAFGTSFQGISWRSILADPYYDARLIGEQQLEDVDCIVVLFESWPATRGSRSSFVGPVVVWFSEKQYSAPIRVRRYMLAPGRLEQQPDDFSFADGEVSTTKWQPTSEHNWSDFERISGGVWLPRSLSVRHTPPSTQPDGRCILGYDWKRSGSPLMSRTEVENRAKSSLQFPARIQDKRDGRLLFWSEMETPMEYDLESWSMYNLTKEYADYLAPDSAFPLMTAEDFRGISCGFQCVFLCSRLDAEEPLRLDEIVGSHRGDKKASFAALIQASKACGYDVEALECDLEHLRDQPGHKIVHVLSPDEEVTGDATTAAEANHFSLAVPHGERVLLFSPPNRIDECSRKQFLARWSGRVLLLN